MPLRLNFQSDKRLLTPAEEAAVRLVRHDRAMPAETTSTPHEYMMWAMERDRLSDIFHDTNTDRCGCLKWAFTISSHVVEADDAKETVP